MSSSIEVRLLGPLEVVVAGGSVEFEGAKQRRLFVALALRAPEAVSVDELVEVVWGDEAPDGRGQALQKQVSRLRARVGERLPVRRRAAGYALEIEREAIDCRRFETLLERARTERSSADAARSARRWRCGAARRSPTIASTRSRRARSRGWRSCTWRRSRSGSTAELARGQAADLVAELRALRRRASAARAAARAADARALPRRPPGGRARGDARGPPVPGRRARARARPGAAPAGADDPRARPGAGRRGPGGVLEAPLPAPANATIGREGELAEIGALLVRPEVRLLTLVGAGGVGKTRLALEAGRALAGRFPGGAAYVNLASVEDAAMLDARGGIRPRRRGRDPGRARRPARARDPRRRRAARARRLRALPRRRRPGRPAARRRAEPDRAGDQPGAAAADRRARLPRAAAGGRKRRGAVHGARGGDPPGLGAARGRRASSRRSARGWTGCRWRSSSPPIARGCCRCRRCWSASSSGWSC